MGAVRRGSTDPLLEAAVGQSMLARLPPELTSEVLDGGYRIDLPAGAQPSTRTNESAVASVWMLVPARLRALCEQHGPLATAVAAECATRASDAIDELALLTFGSVRQRVARHLLDLAASQQQAGDLVAAVTQQELADAAGTVREVVARVLKQLHHAGMTAGSDGGVVILDAARLDAEATAGGADAT